MNSDGFEAFGRLRAAVKADLRDLDPGPSALVLVGCSGGADSLALAAAVQAEGREVGRSTRQRGYSIRVGAIIVDHGLQADSAAVAARAAGQCRRLGLDPVVVRKVELPKQSAEGAARAARFQVFEDVIGDLGAAALYLGHTLDDQAESMLLGLARGSGARSLAGMRAVRGPFRRPLLDLRRAGTLAACGYLGLEPWSDPSNSASGPGAPLRSRVRQEVLPQLEDVLGPGVAEALARSATLLQQDNNALDELAQELFDAARGAGQESFRGLDTRGFAAHSTDGTLTDGTLDGGVVVLDVAALNQAHGAVRRRALRLAALQLGVPAGSLTAAHLAGMDTLVANWRGQGPTYLPSGVKVSRRCGRLVFCPPAGPTIPA